ncbi:MAG TPA: hypothetical protein VK939_03115 [Longimicrobiales bacterium]|nr:hypothetical protein [Longimicrobiales bacterium]
MVIITVLRWIARLLASAVAGLLIAFFIDEGVGDPRALTDAELGGLGAVLVMMTGALLGWRWDLLGGTLLLAGYGLLALIEAGWPPLPLAAFGVAGAILVASGLLKKLRRLRRPAEPGAAAGATTATS